jgi:ATP-dependent protease ClpP protease subunit
MNKAVTPSKIRKKTIKKALTQRQITKLVNDNFGKNVVRPAYVDYLGQVNYANNEKTLTSIREIMHTDPNREMFMTVTSPGGPTGTAMSFFDHVQDVLKPNISTIASGDVDSSGIIIFLSGNRRFVTKHTTALFHLAGRTFTPNTRFTAGEIEAMFREDKLKDEHYADVVASKSGGKLNKEDVLRLMEENTIFGPEDFILYGLAEAIL